MTQIGFVCKGQTFSRKVWDFTAMSKNVEKGGDSSEKKTLY